MKEVRARGGKSRQNTETEILYNLSINFSTKILSMVHANIVVLKSEIYLVLNPIIHLILIHDDILGYFLF